MVLQLGQETTIIWNGRDMWNIVQPTGVYLGQFLHLDTNEMRTIKLVMIR